VRLLPRFARAADGVELMDGPVPDAQLAPALRDIARLNGLFGGRRLSVRYVRELVARHPRDRMITVLDVGTGGADVPVALARWARREQRRIRIVALDRDPAALATARRAARRYPEIVFVQGDALRLPARAAAVDVAMSALVLHHLAPHEAARSIAEMERVSRAGFVANDLARSRAAYALVWIATRLVAVTRMARHDGPMSVRRAYTPGELRALCARAGVLAARVCRHAWLARHCAVRTKA